MTPFDSPQSVSTALIATPFFWFVPLSILFYVSAGLIPSLNVFFFPLSHTFYGKTIYFFLSALQMQWEAILLISALFPSFPCLVISFLTYANPHRQVPHWRSMSAIKATACGCVCLQCPASFTLALNIGLDTKHHFPSFHEVAAKQFETSPTAVRFVSRPICMPQIHSKQLADAHHGKFRREMRFEWSFCFYISDNKPPLENKTAPS